MKASKYLSTILALALLPACAGTGDGDDDDNADGGMGSCSPDGIGMCEAGSLSICEDGQWVFSETCAGDTPYCDPQFGCVACEPGTTFCDGNNVMECAADGSEATLLSTCSEEETCVDGACSNSCTSAADGKSYLGCEFLAVSTSNPLLDAPFDNDFAVVIGVPQGTPDATITVTRGGQNISTTTVPSGTTAAITLPMVTEIKNAQESILVADAAYEVSSNVPVVAYQYNPLHFTMGETPSYTNDASLLLPEHALTDSYMVSTWPTWGRGSFMQGPFGGITGSWTMYPGFAAIAATEDATQVTITASNYTQGSTPPALAPGESATVTLNRGDVLQLYSFRPEPADTDMTFCEDNGWPMELGEGSVCPPTTLIQECDKFCSVTDADLTGTTIEATAPVAVFGGHMCTFMPFYEWACDHLEEMMLPLDAWGDSSVMTAPLHPDPENGLPVPTLYRVIAREGGTQLSFTPQVHDDVTVGARVVVQFQTEADFAVQADGQIYVTQTLLGQNELDSIAGDPAMGSGVPLFQTRGAYSFLTPDTYTTNYLNVVAPSGTTVTLDGMEVGPWDTIGSTGFSVARVPIEPGSHRAESFDDVGFGITSYGYASYTSYLYPGGMNLGSFIE